MFLIKDFMNSPVLSVNSQNSFEKVTKLMSKKR